MDENGGPYPVLAEYYNEIYEENGVYKLTSLAIALPEYTRKSDSRSASQLILEQIISVIVHVFKVIYCLFTLSFINLMNKRIVFLN